MYFTYTFCLFVGLLVSAPWYLIRSRKYIATIKSRFGFPNIPSLRQSIWVHAVSVGEVRAVQKLLRSLRLQYPERPLILSTITPTGQQLALETAGLADHVFYFPFDFPGAIRRTLTLVDPELIIIAETEIWPNFLRACRQKNIPVVMVNGRISDRSLPRYRWIRRWLKLVLNDYSVLGMQSEQDRERIESLGAERSKVHVFGNLKYDSSSSGTSPDSGLALLLKQSRPLWIAASTTSVGTASPTNEEELVLASFATLRQRHPDLKLLIAPRHPERFDVVERLVEARGFRCLRRTALNGAGSFNDVLLLDTIGELAASFAFASVVFMGGTLVPRGGHNILEPAAAARAIVFGPHMENFREISSLFLNADAAIQVSNSDELASAVDRLLTNAATADAMGKEARRIVEHNHGATDRVMSFLQASAATTGTRA
ncbi:MAG TPA: 3-deoxy-D-manno-octulosonic acid transferase [Terriglobia bacterium]|nr:3-deoxy-D-manno-octulosonic acid transferase [Terriglobia bacterium]